MTLKFVLAGAVLAMTPSSAFAQGSPPPPPRPSSDPDWKEIRRSAEAALKSSLVDPSSAQIEWLNGWDWGHIKPFKIISKRTWGWLGCANLNAKNRMGGYVGAVPVYVLVTPEGRVLTGRQVEVTSECDRPVYTPLQAEFKDTPTTSKSSLADELRKLGDLKKDGLLTEEEFQAQKSKLLSQEY